MLQDVIAILQKLNVFDGLKSVILKLKNVAPKTWMRVALCLFTVLSLTVGGLALDNFVIIDGDSVYHVTAHAETVDEVIDSAGIKLSPGDIVTTRDENGKTVISIDRADSILISGEDGITVESIGGKVFNSDRWTIGIQSSLDASDGTANVQNTGVTYVYETVTEIIKHDYATVKSRDLLKGTVQIAPGSDGEKQTVYKKTMINGIVVSSEVSGEVITKEPVTQVETVGTRVVNSSDKAVMTSDDVKSVSIIKPDKPIELDANGVPINYADCISGKASAYWGDKWTAVGLESKPGYIAVNPNQIPYGTKMYIVSQDGKYVYGYCIAADTGGFAYNGSGRLVDLRFPTESSGSKFGVRMVNIYILE